MHMLAAACTASGSCVAALPASHPPSHTCCCNCWFSFRVSPASSSAIPFSPSLSCCLSYTLQINFDRLTSAASKFLPSNDLPALPLPVTIASCAPGSQPTTALDDCVECTSGTYNLDGAECETCPKGACWASSQCV